MAGGERILIAAALAKIIQPALTSEFPNAELDFTEDRVAVERAVSERMRFDVVVSDLTWNDYTSEFSFDGLDVLDILRRKGKSTSVIFAAQGHGIERDHLDEAIEQREVAGIYRKAAGPELLCDAIRIAIRGDSLPVDRFPPGANPPEMRIHRYFSKGRGLTAARMAGAIASGRAVNHETLASIAAVGPGTANRLVEYLGPLIESRGEHISGLKMTPEVVYRWCGEHSRYILSWCRRNGPPGFSAWATRRV